MFEILELKDQIFNCRYLTLLKIVFMLFYIGKIINYIKFSDFSQVLIVLSKNNSARDDNFLQLIDFIAIKIHNSRHVRFPGEK